MYQELLELVSPDDVRGSLDTQIIESLGGSDNLTSSVSAACAWAFAMLRKAGRTSLPEETDVLRFALIKRAAYELYTSCDVEEDAEDKRKDAYILMQGLLGTNIEDQSQPASGSISFDRVYNSTLIPPGFEEY
jgi:hypothetical protein